MALNLNYFKDAFNEKYAVWNASEKCKDVLIPFKQTSGVSITI